MTMLATIGATALWLMYAWLAGAILASVISRRKGYGERPGLATGLLTSLLAPVIWLFVPARPDSLWKIEGALPRRRRPARRTRGGVPAVPAAASASSRSPALPQADPAPPAAERTPEPEPQPEPPVREPEPQPEPPVREPEPQPAPPVREPEPSRPAAGAPQRRGGPAPKAPRPVYAPPPRGRIAAAPGAKGEPLAPVALVLALLGGSLIAVIVALIALGRIEHAQGDLRGHGVARLALIIGLAECAVGLVVLLAAALT